MELLIFTLLLTFCLYSFYFVYKVRGEVRYSGFSEYVRKGWPLFSPFNCFLYTFTKPKARKAIMSIDDFPELTKLKDHWKDIRREALLLKENGYFEKTTKEDSSAYYDLGFRTFYKYGWSKFYVTWYGHNLKSAKELCPKTVQILNSVNSVNGAMFSLLPIGSQLTRHLDPIASSLRLHISLDTPEDPKCFINVDGVNYTWKDGEAFLFDETYIHFAKNDSDKDRLILMCDIDRPLYFPGRLINSFAKFCFKASIVPNLEGDKRGLVNIIFSSVTPTMAKIRELKKSNLFLYKVIKYSVNLSLLGLLVSFIYFSVNFILDILF